MNKIKSFSKIKELEKTFDSVFKNKVIFGEVFHESVEEKILLCPTENYFLNEKQFEALINTLRQMGETSCVVSITEFENMFSLDSEHILLDVDSLDYKFYLQEDIYLENVIYSEKGNWGIMVSHEDFAIIGGEKVFIDIFKKYYTMWEEDIKNFKEIWMINQKEYNSDISWIKDFQKYLGVTIFK